jgi:hypothetical protein
VGGPPQYPRVADSPKEAPTETMEDIVRELRASERAADEQRYPLLEYPNRPPLGDKSHMHGRWVSSTHGHPVWQDYIPPIDYDLLPKNTSEEREHWVSRFLPDGRYVLEDATGEIRPIPVSDIRHPKNMSERLRESVEATKAGPIPTPRSTTKGIYEPVPRYIEMIPEATSQQAHDTQMPNRAHESSAHQGPMTRTGDFRTDDAYRLRQSTTPRHWSQAIPTGNTQISGGGTMAPGSVPGTNQGHSQRPAQPRFTPIATPGTGGNNPSQGFRRYGSIGGSPEGTPWNPGYGSNRGSGFPPPPPPPPTPPPAATVAPIPSRTRKPPFALKPNVNAYPEYLNTSDYPTWIERVVALLRAHRMPELLNPNHRPNAADPDDVEDWAGKQSFAYVMLMEKVKTPTGKRIVQLHRDHGDAQRVFAELAAEAQTSTQAVLSNRALLTQITAQRYDGRSSKTAVTFITEFECTVDRFNEQQSDPNMRLSAPMMKTLLEAAVSQVPMLLDVSNREQENIVRGVPPFNYVEYLQLVKSAASLYDQKKVGYRSVNMTTTEPTTDLEITNEITEFCVNQMKRRMPGSSMDKETWNALSEGGKKTWDALPDTDKLKVLQYAKKRAEKAKVDVNQHSTEAHETLQEELTDLPEPEGTTEEPPLTTAEIHNAIAKARSEAHPGDARRMMGGEPIQRKEKTQVKFASWNVGTTAGDDSDDEGEDLADLDEMLEQYWQDDDSDGEGDFHRGD